MSATNATENTGPSRGSAPAGSIGRSCGSCSACCTALGIRELGKPAFQVCCNVRSGGGCGIYAERPNSCRVYRCAWLEGLGKRRHRPDRVGVIVDQMAPASEVQAAAAAGDAEAAAKVDAACKTVRAREAWPGALQEKAGKALAEALSRQGLLVVLVPWGGRKLPVGGPL